MKSYVGLVVQDPASKKWLNLAVDNRPILFEEGDESFDSKRKEVSRLKSLDDLKSIDWPSSPKDLRWP